MTTRTVTGVQTKPIWRVLVGPLACGLLTFSSLLSPHNTEAHSRIGQIKHPTRTVRGAGTAFAIRPDGLFMTNFHVVDKAEAIELTCPGLDSVPAVVETFSSALDLAVLKVRRGRPRTYLIFADQKAIQLGARVFTIGYPTPAVLGGRPTYSEGTISALSGPHNDTWLQISVPVLPGSSGSPLVNEKGEVVGVVVGADARYSLGMTGTLPRHIGWAIKGQYATALFERPPPETAERAVPAWLVGTWEGQHVGPAIHADVSRFEFTEEKDKRRWTMSRHTSVGNWIGSLRASGVVRAITDSTVELEGAYDTFSQAHTPRASLNYELSRRGDTLEGPVVGAENTSFGVLLRRNRAPQRGPAEPDRIAVIRQVMEATCLVIVEKQKLQEMSEQE